MRGAGGRARRLTPWATGVARPGDSPLRRSDFPCARGDGSPPGQREKTGRRGGVHVPGKMEVHVPDAFPVAAQ